MLVSLRKGPGSLVCHQARCRSREQERYLQLSLLRSRLSSNFRDLVAVQGDGRSLSSPLLRGRVSRCRRDGLRWRAGIAWRVRTRVGCLRLPVGGTVGCRRCGKRRRRGRRLLCRRCRRLLLDLHGRLRVYYSLEAVWRGLERDDEPGCGALPSARGRGRRSLVRGWHRDGPGFVVTRRRVAALFLVCETKKVTGNADQLYSREIFIRCPRRIFVGVRRWRRRALTGFVRKSSGKGK